VELFFILFFGLGQLLDPENKIKKAGTESPTPHFSCGGTPKYKIKLYKINNFQSYLNE
jgi:hypothetical protein